MECTDVFGWEDSDTDTSIVSDVTDFSWDSATVTTSSAASDTTNVRFGVEGDDAHPTTVGAATSLAAVGRNPKRQRQTVEKPLRHEGAYLSSALYKGQALVSTQDGY